jgi:hypothetical protein
MKQIIDKSAVRWKHGRTSEMEASMKSNVKDIPGINTTKVVLNWDQLMDLCADRGFNDIENKWIYRGQESVG